MTTDVVTQGSESAPESEITIYAKITNAKGLREAISREEHEQIQQRLTEDSSIRVRKTTKDGEVKLELTIKNKIQSDTEGVQSTQETTIVIDDGFYQAFKQNAPELVLKTRYVFKSSNVRATLTNGTDRQEVTLPELLYEVDVFHVDKHQMCVWCKIDVEVDKIYTFMEQNYPAYESPRFNIKVSHLPFAPTEAFMKDEHISEIQSTLLDDLWQNFFTQKTKLGKQGNPMTIES